MMEKILMAKAKPARKPSTIPLIERIHARNFVNAIRMNHGKAACDALFFALLGKA